MSEHRVGLLRNVLGQWRAICASCSWETQWASRQEAAGDKRDHERVRAEKSKVHPWLDVK